MHGSRILFALALPALLAACAHDPHAMRGAPMPIAPPNLTCPPTGPCDVPIDGMTGLPPDNIHAHAGRTTAILWHLPQGSPLRFNSPGIVFDANGADVFTCRPNPTANGKTVVCRNSGRVDENGYYYRIRLIGAGGPFEIDPFVWNF